MRVARRIHRRGRTLRRGRDRESSARQQHAHVTADQRTRRSRAATPTPRESRSRYVLIGGDITEVVAPIIVVGHYKGVPPTRAVGAIDQKLERLDRSCRAHGDDRRQPRRNVLRAERRQTYRGGRRGARGHGRVRTIHARRPRAADVERDRWRVGARPGAFARCWSAPGKGNLQRETALRAFLEGVADGANASARSGGTPAYVAVRSRSSRNTPRRSRDSKSASAAGKARNLRGRRRAVTRTQGVAYRRQRRERADDHAHRKEGRALRGQAGAKRTKPEKGDSQSRLEEVRLTVERSRGHLPILRSRRERGRPVREVAINAGFAAGAADRLMESSTRDEQDQVRRLLYTYLVPEEFHRVIDSGKPLKLILDRRPRSTPGRWQAS